jgi:aspartate aminotransferase
MAVTATPATIPGAVPRRPAAPASRPGHLVAGHAAGQVPISATLAAQEELTRRRRAGLPVLPLAFGEAGLPVPPALLTALASVTGGNSYGPVAGRPALRAAAAGYWTRRGLPTTAEAVVAGPGSKALLFGLLLALGTDVAMPRPSWVSYAAQTTMIGARAHLIPVPPGEGGICDPDGLARAVRAARRAGRRIGAVIATLPDNPTGQLARPSTVRALADVAAEHDLVIIADEIYRDLVYAGPPGAAGAPPPDGFASPAAFAPDRTVVTTAPSKSLALGGWRIGVARLPDGRLGRELGGRLLGIGSEIWSATAGPIQEAAALAFLEPPEITERIRRSARLHATVCRAVAARFAAAGLAALAPQAAFYCYPDFGPWRAHLARAYGLTTGAGLAGHLLDRYGMGVLPASAFGEPAAALRVRAATALLYGDTVAQQEHALAAADPLALPWIAAALARLDTVLADLAPR